MKTTFTSEPVEPFQILSSTTSHKREPLVPTGNESDYVDVEAELALLLWSEPPI